MTDEQLAAEIKQSGTELGFGLIGIAPASRPETFDHLKRWIQDGHHGDMAYIPRREDAYADPNRVLQGVRNAIVAAMHYDPPRSRPDERGQIAAYAQGTADYHDVIRARLKQLASVVHQHRPQARCRVVIDTAPVLERDIARQAGIGWFGKNTMLINKHTGSYFFVGAILTDCHLPPDPPHAASHCGTCTSCLDACPTDAFPEPYVLDARRCISYLTIEYRNKVIPDSLKEQMEDWLFGCDICQAVCPWNRKAPDTVEIAFRRDADQSRDAVRFLSMTDELFEEEFGKTPLARPGRNGMARNAAIALGNLRDESAFSALQVAAESPNEEVADAARWAIDRITKKNEPLTG